MEAEPEGSAWLKEQDKEEEREEVEEVEEQQEVEEEEEVGEEKVTATTAAGMEELGAAVAGEGGEARRRKRLGDKLGIELDDRLAALLRLGAYRRAVEGVRFGEGGEISK